MKKYIGKFIDIETGETLYTTVINQGNYRDAMIVFNGRLTDCSESDVFDEVGSQGFRIELKEWNK